jgi:hypothetical protein
LFEQLFERLTPNYVPPSLIPIRIDLTMFDAESSSPPFSSDRRASLISDAAVERGRVSNALDKLRKVEEERSQVELSAANEQKRLQQEFSIEIQRRDAKIAEVERLLQHAERASSENEVQLASSTWQQGYVWFLYRFFALRFC